MRAMEEDGLRGVRARSDKISVTKLRGSGIRDCDLMLKQSPSTTGALGKGAPSACRRDRGLRATIGSSTFISFVLKAIALKKFCDGVVPDTAPNTFLIEAGFFQRLAQVTFCGSLN